jgi:polyhydroxybutyrate depolymerase
MGLAVSLLSGSCAVPCSERIKSPGDYECAVPGWNDRAYSIHLPPNYSSSERIPVVVSFHGGGGQKDNVNKVSCPDGDEDNDKCLFKLADREGFAVVTPNGTSYFFLRTFNATNSGNGTGEYACISPSACTNNIDDVGYFRALLSELDQAITVDESRIFLTGISNGAAMAHRLACEMADRVAAIAPIAGENQYSAVNDCKPARPVPVMEFHGTGDPFWSYGTDTEDIDLNGEGKALSVSHSISGWVSRNGCSATPTTENLPDSDSNDGSTVTKEGYSNCQGNADVILYKITGGGHTWPDGYQYFLESIVGPTNRDINANQLMWEFFKAHPKP